MIKIVGEKKLTTMNYRKVSGYELEGSCFRSGKVIDS